MKKLIFIILLTVPFMLEAQQPKMHIKLYAGINVSTFVYRVENVNSDLLAGFQLGGGFRIKKRALFGEIDFAYITQGITYSPRDEDDLAVEDDISIILRGFQVPILAGWVPVRTPVFGLYLYGGLENRFSMNGRIYYKDEEILFKPKEAKLHFYNLGARFGTQIDLAMFNFDFSYIIGVTNSFRDRTRTNSHIFMFNVGFLF